MDWAGPGWSDQLPTGWIPAASRLHRSPWLAGSRSSRQKQPVLARTQPPAAAPAQAGVSQLASPGPSTGTRLWLWKETREQITQAEVQPPGPRPARWRGHAGAGRFQPGRRVGEVGRSQGPCCPSSNALLCSFFPPSLFGNDFISSIINHLTAIVAESNPLTLLWEQPQGRRQVSRKHIREQAARESRQAGVGGGGLPAQRKPFPISSKPDIQGTETGRVWHANSLLTHPTGQPEECSCGHRFG